MKFIVNLFCIFLATNTYCQSDRVFYEIVQTKEFNKTELKSIWKDMHTPQIAMPINSGFRFVDINYYTQWHDGSKILASGFLMVPTDRVKETSSELIYLHGTKISKARGINIKNGEQFICASFAAEGYVVYFPDYIGLGRGERFHLYQHEATQSSSSLDFMRAARQYIKDVNYQSDSRLFITGYSQGGHVALGLHKRIQEHYSNEFNVVASSPMSGPYDMSGVQSESMFRQYEFPSYFPYLLRSFDEVYNLFDEEFSSLFLPPYDTIVANYYKGDYDIWEINPLLPKVPIEALKPEAKAKYLEKGERFNQILKVISENNVYDWAPKSPVQLCYCESDEQVKYQNAIVAYQQMRKLGSDMVMLQSGGKKFDHFQCSAFSTMYTKLFFEAVRKGKKKLKGNSFKRFLVKTESVLNAKYYRKTYNKQNMPLFMKHN